MIKYKKRNNMSDINNQSLFGTIEYTNLAGVDEAGRGPLAGRVYAAAVILGEEGLHIDGLNDSKKLSEKKRLALYPIIKEKALAYCVAYADENEIDRLNILQATFLAMRRAVAGLNVKYDYIKVDGNKYPFDTPGEAVVKGDSKVKEIMAASILAKVERDLYMLEMDKIYPEYKFAEHKGYPTVLHVEMLRKYGICPIHRKTFGIVKDFL